MKVFDEMTKRKENEISRSFLLFFSWERCCGVCHSLIFLTRRYWRRGIREHEWVFHSLIFVTFKHIAWIYFLKCKVKTQRTCDVVNGFLLFEVFEMCLRCPNS
eukprot:TRINITY_DN4038_c0_g2_i10.p2 TRINITY_DN4038_c0_g2~~TRINITY_DN4038_c0_g2_i10.p2  ORF type:complete len:103 (-),score=11.89 TRINITY_DN4038_c0_g2_i10:234-542(-)